MKVKLKQVKGDSFEVEAGEDETVGALKRKVTEARPEFPAEQQTLIYAGKILKDESKVQEIGLKPGDFVVVLNKAKAAAPKAAAAAPAQAPAAPAPVDVAPAAAPQAAAAPPASAGDNPAVQQLCDMGFARQEVERCLAAAFGNPDRAADYLMSGIPQGAGAAETGPPPAAPTANQGAGGLGPGGVVPFPAMGAPGGGDDDYDDGDEEDDLPPELAELRDSPQFEQLAAMVVQQPQMVEQMLGALAQTNPELVRAIRENPWAFMRMVQDAVGGEDGDEDEDDAVEAMLAAAGQGGEGGEGGGAPPAGVLPEDNDAVSRLMALGFDQQMCVQAYLLCDRNEELAANFLFDNGDGMVD